VTQVPDTPATAWPPVEQPWQRLNPLMLLVHPVHELARFFPLVIASVVFGSSGGPGGPWYWLGIGIPVLLGVTRFLTTRYRITSTQIELRRGLLSKSVLTAPLDRVRTIELTSTPIHRVLGLARVQIGTGGATRPGQDRLVLDSLATSEARELRIALLHRSGQVAEVEETDGSQASGDARLAGDRVLLDFDPRWVRYAPLTSSGVVIAAAIAAGLGQLTEAVGDQMDQWSLPDPTSWSLWVAVPLGLVVAAVLFAVFAVLGYLVTNWDFRLGVDPAGRSYHVRRGLLTTRETSLETERVRGVELHQPLGLRLGGAARLNAAVTGLGRSNGGTSPLTPPAPFEVVTGVGGEVLGGSDALARPLREHGPRALRRRYWRAAASFLVPFAGLAWLAVAQPDWRWVLVPAVLALLLIEPLAKDRYRRLGHGLDDRHLVVSSGTFAHRRDVLERSGIIGWNITQTWFQRRAGQCTLAATTSAGKQAYRAYDEPLAAARAVAHRAVPGLVSQFRG
jgi:putative membrane protein